MIGHFSAEDLASYRAGAIDADRAARISAHLADCARCADLDSDLAGVSALLASVPAPPMPDRLTERVQAAIAAESERRVASSLAGAQVPAPAQPTGPVPVPGRPDLPDLPRRRRSRSRRSFWTSPLVLGGLAVTGVFAFVVIGAAIAINHYGISGAASGPEAANPAAPRALPKPTPRYQAGSGSNALGTRSGLKVSYHGRAHEATATVLTSNARYTRGNIARIVRSDVSATILSPTYGTGTAEPRPASTQKTHQPSKAPDQVGSVSLGQISACLSADAPSNGVLVVEIAHYQGKPAMIIVSKPVGNFYRVTVAGLACSASRPDVLARITVPKAR